jgi:probable rRNA maturation factor
MQVKDYFYHLLIHSLLHLIGFDHESDEDEAIMKREEERVLDKFKIESIYKNESY